MKPWARQLEMLEELEKANPGAATLAKLMLADQRPMDPKLCISLLADALELSQGAVVCALDILIPSGLDILIPSGRDILIPSGQTLQPGPNPTCFGKRDVARVGCAIRAFDGRRSVEQHVADLMVAMQVSLKDLEERADAGCQRVPEAARHGAILPRKQLNTMGGVLGNVQRYEES